MIKSRLFWISVLVGWLIGATFALASGKYITTTNPDGSVTTCYVYDDGVADCWTS